MLIKSTLAAAALAVAIAAVPASASAGSRTNHFIGGVAAGVGSVMLLNALNQPRRSHYYDPAPRHYYKPAPRYRRACFTQSRKLNKLRRQGYGGFSRIRYRRNSIKMRAWKHGWRYNLSITRCRGNIIGRWRV